jgi:hypothetical protein
LYVPADIKPPTEPPPVAETVGADTGAAIVAVLTSGMVVLDDKVDRS